MTVLRGLLLRAAFVLAVWPAGGAASAQSLDGKYIASLTCAKLPFTDAVLDNEPVALTVANGKATYSRTIYGANRKAVAGKETGSGSVAADGTIALTGGWTGKRDSVTATYNGRLAGGAARLDGKQVVRFQGQAYDRKCTMTVQRR